MNLDSIQKTRIAYAELDEFIELLDKEDRNKIPSKLRGFFKEEKDKNYFKNISTEIPIEEQNLKEETLALIALLYLKYICEDEDEKQNLRQIYEENEKKYREQMRERYDPEKAIERKNKQNKEENEINSSLATGKEIVPKKESIMSKIINKIKAFFKRNK